VARLPKISPSLAMSLSELSDIVPEQSFLAPAI
jgi:hypothetical protein